MAIRNVRSQVVNYVVPNSVVLTTARARTVLNARRYCTHIEKLMANDTDEQTLDILFSDDCNTNEDWDSPSSEIHQ